MTDNEISGVLNILQNNGIEFSYFFDGMYIINPDVIITLLKDGKSAAFAKLQNIPEKVAKDYFKTIQHKGECTGITKKGKKCKKYVDYSIDSLNDFLNNFTPGISDRCHLHIGKETVIFNDK